MRIETSSLVGPLLISPKKHGDNRGFFSETWKASAMRAAGVDIDWVQDNHSLSAEVGTLRGLHYQAPPHAQAKLVRVPRGAILDVVVDVRHGSPTFGRHESFRLSADSWNQLFVPVGFAHGLCTLEPDTEVLYKVSSEYAPESDFGLAWDDPALGIAWPFAPEAIKLSDKDRRHPTLGELPRHFTWEPS